jgi:hypothetical protein
MKMRYVRSQASRVLVILTVIARLINFMEAEVVSLDRAFRHFYSCLLGAIPSQELSIASLSEAVDRFRGERLLTILCAS